jgi:hypothetical protein
VIENPLFDLVPRHAGLRRGIRGFDAEHNVEWCDAELAQRQRSRFGHHSRGIVDALDRAANLRAIAEQLERPEVEHRLRESARLCGDTRPARRVRRRAAHQEQ